MTNDENNNCTKKQYDNDLTPPTIVNINSSITHHYLLTSACCVWVSVQTQLSQNWQLWYDKPICNAIEKLRSAGMIINCFVQCLQRHRISSVRIDLFSIDWVGKRKSVNVMACFNSTWISVSAENYYHHYYYSMYYDFLIS